MQISKTLLRYKKGYDIKADNKEHENLVRDIRNWLLIRKLERSYLCVVVQKRFVGLEFVNYELLQI